MLIVINMAYGKQRLNKLMLKILLKLRVVTKMLLLFLHYIYCKKLEIMIIFRGIKNIIKEKKNKEFIYGKRKNRIHM